MKIYIRYVLFGTLKIFFLSLLLTTIGLLFYFVVETSIKRGIPFSLSFSLTPYIIPDLLSKTLPLASLFAVCIFFARMGGNNEIIALKAMGIAPWRVLLPIWIFMFCLSLTSVWINDLSTSWSRMQMKRVLLEGFESTILTQLRSERRFVMPTGKYVVEVSDVGEDGTLINPSFSGKGGEISGVAESAKIEVDFDSENPTVNIRLYNTEVYAPRGQALFPQELNLGIPLDEIFRSALRVDPPAAKIKDALTNLEMERTKVHRRLASKAMFAFLCGNLMETTTEAWRNRESNEKNFTKQQNRYHLTIPRIWAAGFSCFFFAWVGAPFAIWYDKSDFTSAFFVCFLPILIVYYPLFMFGLEGSKSGVVPPISTWLGNVALGIIGMYFLKKIH